MGELREFGAWYAKHLFASMKMGFSLQKSVLGWMFLLLGVFLILCPFWAEAVIEQVQWLEKPLKWIGPAFIFLLVTVFGPLWSAFQESKSKDKTIGEAQLKSTQEIRAIENRYTEELNKAHGDRQRAEAKADAKPTHWPLIKDFFGRLLAESHQRNDQRSPDNEAWAKKVEGYIRDAILGNKLMALDRDNLAGSFGGVRTWLIQNLGGRGLGEGDINTTFKIPTQN